MKKFVPVFAAFLLGIALPIFAQSPMAPSLLRDPFYHWPALYSAAEDLGIKRGLNADGTVNDKVYLRIGWGPCLAVYLDEWDALVTAAQTDRYINMRDYADSQWNKTAAGTDMQWGPDDSVNCPDEPSPTVDLFDYVFGATS